MHRILRFSLFSLIFGISAEVTATPKVTFDYSYALDFVCPEPVAPTMQDELLARLPELQQEWNAQGPHLLKATVAAIGTPFPAMELQAAVFACPRFPSMGTPLALNSVAYLQSAASLIPEMGGQTLPVFFFVSTAFHEILHKYIQGILEKRPSRILLAHTRESELYKAHLHLFALQKKVFEDLKLGNLLDSIGKVEALHGADYARAWRDVHGDPSVCAQLIEELR